MNQQERSRQYYVKHREEILAKTKAYRLKNMDKINEYARKHRERKSAHFHGYFLKYKYGITAEQFATMLKAQGGAGAVVGCGNDGSEDKRRRRLFVDHNHETGKVRALLCCNCNRVLGMMKESPALLRGLAEYAERHNGG